MPTSDCCLLSVLGSACLADGEGPKQAVGRGMKRLAACVVRIALCACGPRAAACGESKGRSVSQKPHTCLLGRPFG